jgi:hypothetical protein
VYGVIELKPEPIESLVNNKQLLERIMSHYLFRLHHISEDEKTKLIMSPTLSGLLPKKEVETKVYEVLAIKGDAETRADFGRMNSKILTAAARCYCRDLKAFRDQVGDLLPDLEHNQLEDDWTIMAGYFPDTAPLRGK